MQPADRLHVNDAAIHDQVAPFDQLDSHLLREKAVLEIGAVVNAGRQQDDLCVGLAARRKAAQNPRKLRRIMMDGKNFAGLKCVGECARHHQAIFEDVGNSAGRANVVFEHEEIAALGIAHQVNAADVRVNAARDFDADHFAPEIRAGIDERARNFAVFEDGLLAVNILQEKIQRHHALREARARCVPIPNAAGCAGIRSNGNRRSVPRPSL